MAEFKFVANITDRHGNPMIGVDVEAIDVNLYTAALRDGIQHVVAVETTDISGTATFENLPIGMYFARPRINRDDVRIQIMVPSGMGGGGKMCYAALVQPDGIGTHRTIQSAITDLGTSGGVVYICAGTYTEDITVAGDTANLWLIGASRAEVTIVGNFSVQAVGTGPVENFRMEHLTLNGDAGVALYFNSVAGGQPDSVELLDLRFINATVGIDLSDLNGGTDFVLRDIVMESSVVDAGQLEVITLDIADSYFGVAGLGLYIGGATALTDVKVSNCTFRGGSTYALRILNATKLVLGNCRFVAVGAGTGGILLGNNGTIVLSNSTFDIQEGIGIDAAPAVIAGLTLENLQLVCAVPQTVDRVGIDIGDNVSELVIDGCRIKNFESYGISLGAVQHYIISDNIIVNGGDTHSIYLGGADYGSIVGNNLRGTGGAATTYGVYGAAGTTNTVIVGNVVRSHDDLTNLVNGVDGNVLDGNIPPGPGGAFDHRIQDLDNDTYVDTEAAADEDKVRAGVGGTERLIIQTATPHFIQTGDVEFRQESFVLKFTDLTERAKFDLTAPGANKEILNITMPTGDELFYAAIRIYTNSTLIDTHRAILIQNEGVSDSFYTNVTAGGMAYAADIDGADSRGFGVWAKPGVGNTNVNALTINFDAASGQALAINVDPASSAVGFFVDYGGSGNPFLIRDQLAGPPANLERFLITTDFVMAFRTRDTAAAIFKGIYIDEANPRVQIQLDRIAFGPGGAGALDVELRREGANTLALGSGDILILRTDSDTAFNIKSVADLNRFYYAVTSQEARFYRAAAGRVLFHRLDADALARFEIRSDSIQFGGGAAAVDTVLARTAAGVWRTTSLFEFPEIATPANPAANFGRFYAKDVAGVTKPMWLDSAGTETDLTSGGVGGGHTIRNEGVDLAARTGLNFRGGIVVAVDDAGGDESEVRIGMQPDGTDLFITADAAPHLTIGVAGKTIALLDTLRFATAAVAHIQDSGGNERMRFAIASPHLTLTGAVAITGPTGVGGATPVAGIGLNVAVGDAMAVSGYGANVSPAWTATANNNNAFGLYGGPTLSGVNFTGLNVYGLDFIAKATSNASSPTFALNIGMRIRTNIGSLGGSGTCTVTLERGIWVAKPVYSVIAGGAIAVTTHRGIEIEDVASNKVGTQELLRIGDATLATVINRILQLGPGGGYLVLKGSGEWSAADYETPLWLGADSPTTLQQVTVGANDSGGAGYRSLRIPNL